LVNDLKRYDAHVRALDAIRAKGRPLGDAYHGESV